MPGIQTRIGFAKTIHRGLFKVPNASFIGKPENGPAYVINYVIETNGEQVNLTAPLIYKWTDPVRGELTRPVEVVPPVLLSLSQKVYVFKDLNPKTIGLLVKSASGTSLAGSVKLVLPEGWRSEPASVSIELGRRGEEKKLDFVIFPSPSDGTFTIKAQADINGRVLFFLGSDYFVRSYSVSDIASPGKGKRRAIGH